MPEAAVGGGQRLAAVAQLIFLMRRPYRAVQLKGWQRLVCSRTVGLLSVFVRRAVRNYVEHIILDCQLDMNIIITTINYYAVQVSL